MNWFRQNRLLGTFLVGFGAVHAGRALLSVQRQKQFE